MAEWHKQTARYRCARGHIHTSPPSWFAPESWRYCPKCKEPKAARKVAGSEQNVGAPVTPQAVVFGVTIGQEGVKSTVEAQEGEQ